METKRCLLAIGYACAVLAAGCGGKPPGGPGDPGTCQTGCQRGFVCQATACVLNPTGVWALTVTGGKISERDPSGSAWDVPGGLPDPYVCLTINGSRKCTQTRSDTLMPQWNAPFLATATALMAGVTAEVWDEDVASNDPICAPGLLTVSQQDLLSGAWGGSCPQGQFDATLEAQ